MSKYTYRFDPDAENNTAATVYRLARSGGKRVLDVGSGPGVVSRALAYADGKHVTCVDADPAAIAEAREAGLNALEVDLLRQDWTAKLADAPYDVVILADVLEHLPRPQDLLTTLRSDGVLADDGIMVVSVPNVAHESLIAELIAGHFSYTPTGLLDETHLRWFTRDSITSMLESTGFLVTQVHRTMRTTAQTPQVHRRIELPDAVWEALAELGDDARTYQYVLVVRPSSAAGQLAAMREHLDAERASMSKRLEAATKKLRQATGERQRLAGQLEAEQRRRVTAEDRLKALRSSKTHRAGVAVRKLSRPLTTTRAALRGERK